MPTITGTIRGVDNVASSWILTFKPQDTPEVVGSVVAVGMGKKVVLESDGDLPSGVELLGGVYTVEINNGESFEILVPATGGPYDIKDIFYSEAALNITFIGDVDPEGVVTLPPGMRYFNRTNNSDWVKRTGTGNTGWQQLSG